MARIGTVGYLNARPLSDRIDIDRHTLVLAHPAEIARQLREREVDVALVPVAAALSDGDYQMVGGVGIGAEGPVASVLLVAEQPPETWTEVLLDGVSRTSVVLAQLLLDGPLKRRAKGELTIRHVGPNEGVAQAEGSVAALVIGDAARELPDRLTHRIDLAEAWFEWTGLPFVFAVWAGQPDLDPAVVTHLQEAGRAGIAAVPHSYAGADLEYLTRNIRHTLDDKALMGLRRFAALASAKGLVARHDIPLYGPAERTLPRTQLDDLLSKAADGTRLTAEELGLLDEHAALADLALVATLIKEARHPSPKVPYRVDVGVVAADGETLEQIVVGTEASVVDQLVRLREEQDNGGRIWGVQVWAAGGNARGAYGSLANTAADHQRATALARIALDNVDHMVASPATEGLGMAQMSLHLGCDHLGRFRVSDEDEARRTSDEADRHIREAGFEPDGSIRQGVLEASDSSVSPT
ncbi:MAG: MqnA/MqnD/SBP family protein [Myxococcota bacterium]